MDYPAPSALNVMSPHADLNLQADQNGSVYGSLRIERHWIWPNQRKNCLIIAHLLLILLSGCDSGAPDPISKEHSPADPVGRMHDAIRQRNWPLAQEYATQALISNPRDAELMVEAARVAAFNDQKREAARLMVDAVTLTNFQPAARVDFAVQALIDVGEIYKAIDLLQASLANDPKNVSQRRTLVGFLGEVQRTELIGPHFKELIQARKLDVHLLAALTESSSRRFSHNTNNFMLERNPGDLRVRLGEAHEMMNRRDSPAAKEVLDDILKKHPDFAPAHAMQGQVLLQLQELEELESWLKDTPADSRDYPDYWLTIGDLAVEKEELPEASRAFWEATQLDPNNSTAWTRLAQTIRRMKNNGSEAAEQITEQQLADMDMRIADLLELRKRFYDFVADYKKSQRYATRVAESLLKLGRNWEAEAWSAVATTLTVDPYDDLPAVRKAILAKLREDTRWQSQLNQPALSLDLSRFAEPSISSVVTPSRPRVYLPKIASAEQVEMKEETESWGLASVGADNNRGDASLAPLIRSTGVGGGVIDYDLDGLPDIIVMGAGGTMLEQDSKPNELLRNVEGRFLKVTSDAEVTDTGFGQGTAVGDFNEDGFPDLFFANLGKNRLFRNNGDGTFTDCSEQLKDGDQQEWTTTGVFADLNQDGIADLLTTNYCKTISDMDKACPDENGVLGPCHPLRFAAHTDQFFAGTSEGKLIDWTSTWLPGISPARGLGIVAGNLDGKHFGVYVANDMSANVFYTFPGSDKAPLIESAAPRGLAVDGRTLAQASMGIASSDFDGDGDLDFYVTGFGREYNILYDQISPGMWNDHTSRLGLVEPTHDVVGFGTEAIDLDSDGVDEIIVTNGHIGEFKTPDSLPYAQPLQIFRRNQEGGFDLLDDDSWGGYFSMPHVGRALWTMDANRDGRNDVMITHMSEQVCLLVNHSKDENNRVAFKLVATQGSRDAIGATVRFRCNERDRNLWWLAGDGYMCSNERVLRAGLGDANQIMDVTVTWANGSVQKIGTLDTNAEYLVVQGESDAFRLAEFK